MDGEIEKYEAQGECTYRNYNYRTKTDDDTHCFYYVNASATYLALYDKATNERFKGFVIPINSETSIRLYDKNLFFALRVHSKLKCNKRALSLSNPSPNTLKTRNRKGRMSDAEMITILVLFHSNTFRNFKHFYLFYVCRELKEEFLNLLSYTLFVERMPRVAVPL